MASIVLAATFEPSGRLTVVDVPAFPVGGNCGHGFDPLLSGERIGRSDTEPAHPDLVLLDGLLGPVPVPGAASPRPALGGQRVMSASGDTSRSWD